MFAVNHNIPVCESTRHLFPIGSKRAETIKDLSQSTAGNVGNSFDAQVFLNHLNVETIEGIQTLYGLASDTKRLALEVNTEFDLAVLFLQDHIRPSAPSGTMPYARVSEFLRQLKIPVVTVGLGVNGIDPATIKNHLTRSIGGDLMSFLETVAGLSTSIGVRGNSAERAIRAISPTAQVTVIGLPSYFEQPGLYLQSAFQETRSFPRWRMRTAASSKFATGRLSRLVSSASDIYDWPDSHVALASEGTGRRIFVPESYNHLKHHYSKFDFVVGSRLHGTIAALNSGTLALLLNDDYRVREFAEFTALLFLPRHIGKRMSVTSLHKLADYTNARLRYLELRGHYLGWIREFNR